MTSSRSVKTFRRLAMAAVMSALCLFVESAAHADAAHFYKGKRITLIISSRSGSSVDLVGRTIAPMLAKALHATVIPKNMSTAGGMEGLNYVATTAKPDGLTIGMRDSASCYLNQLMKAPGAQWNIATLKYLANIQPSSMVLYVTPGGPIKTIAELRKAKGLKFSSVSPRGWMSSVIAGTIELLGLHAKLVSGFKGSAGAAMAVSKGEAGASAVEGYTLQRYQKKGMALPLLTTGTERDPAYPNLPAITEIVKAPKDSVALFMAGLASGKLMFMPPGTPHDKVAYVANVVWKIINGNEFKTEFMKRVGTDVWKKNVTGAESARLAKKMLARKTLGKEMLAILERHRA